MTHARTLKAPDATVRIRGYTYQAIVVKGGYTVQYCICHTLCNICHEERLTYYVLQYKLNTVITRVIDIILYTMYNAVYTE